MRELIPWLPLGLLFFLAFFDPRRPLRLLHLDLLIMLASSAYALVIWDGASGNNFTAMVLVDLGFVYLIVRMLSLVSRQRRTSDRIIPVLSVRSITVLLVLLVTVRLVYPLFDDRPVIDVGLASVIGADRITHGQELYDGAWGVLNHPDTYGPLTYLAYVPFEQIFPYSSPHRVLAARAAAAAWDLLTILGRGRATHVRRSSSFVASTTHWSRSCS